MTVSARRRERRYGWLAGGVIAAAVLIVFGDHLFGVSTFIGDSDRLNSYLNLRLFEYDSIRTLGRVPLWNEGMFGGFSMAGLHWMNPGPDPIPYFLALFERGEIFRVLGYVSAALTALAGVSAYLYISDLARPGLPAVAGAVVYGLSVYSLHRAAQVDSAQMTLILLPLGLLAIRKAQSQALLAYAGLAAILTVLCFYGFLQEAAYVMIYLGAYSLYRGAAALRAGERDFQRPVTVFAAAVLVALVFAAPRLISVAGDFQQLFRTQTFHYTDYSEIARLVHEGFLGRSMGEGRELGNSLNLHEGLQLLGSSMAIFVVIAGIMTPRSRGELAAALMFLAICGMAFSRVDLLYVPGWHLFPGISRSGAIFLTIFAALVGIAALAAIAKRLGWLPGTAAEGSTRSAHRPARPRDTAFHLGALLTVLILVLVEEARYGLYLAFAKVDFTHSRLSLLATLSLASLFAVYCENYQRPMSPRESGRGMGPLLGAALFAAGLCLAWLINGNLIEQAVGVDAWSIKISNYRLSPIVSVEVGLTLAVFLACVLAAARGKVMGLSAGACAVVLMGGFAIGEAVTYGHFKLAGSHTRTAPIPFKTNNYLTVERDRLRPPADAQVERLRGRLEAERYRSVLIADDEAFPSNNSPHISQFWRLRQLGGYGAGVPARLQALGWPDGVVRLRSIAFGSLEQLSAALLSMLNVKYAVMLDEALYFNGKGGRSDQAFPRIVENPVAPLPRLYLAERITPVAATPVTATTARIGSSIGLEATAVYGGGVLLGWSKPAPKGTERIEIYRQKAAAAAGSEQNAWMEGKGDRVAILGPVAMAWLDPELPPTSQWLYRLLACNKTTCAPMGAPIHVEVAIPGITPPHLAGSSVARNGASGYQLTIRPYDDVELIIEGRVSSMERFAEVARFGRGQGSAMLTFQAQTGSVLLRARACNEHGCSAHSQIKRFSLSGDEWNAFDGKARGVVFAGHRDSVLTNPLVEGISGQSYGFDAGGKLKARYRGDVIDIDVDPSSRQRFLVVNGLYHPSWRAYADGSEIPVFATNAVMRGVRLPAGTRHLQMRFEPFSAAPRARLIELLAVLLFVLGGWILRRRAREGEA